MVHLFTTIARLDIRSAALHLSSGVKMAENHLLEIGHRADPKGDGLPEADQACRRARRRKGSAFRRSSGRHALPIADLFRGFDLIGRHPKRRSFFPPFEFSGGAESLDHPASELIG